VSLVWVEVRVLAKYHHLHLKRENILQHTAQYTALSSVVTSHTSSIVQAVVQVKTSFAAMVNLEWDLLLYTMFWFQAKQVCGPELSFSTFRVNLVLRPLIIEEVN